MGRRPVLAGKRKARTRRKAANLVARFNSNQSNKQIRPTHRAATVVATPSRLRTRTATASATSPLPAAPA